jgi:hypothetical protein
VLVTWASTGHSANPPLFPFPPVYKPIVHSGDKIPADKPADETVCGADQASHKRHPVSDEELTQEGEVRAYYLASL